MARFKHGDIVLVYPNSPQVILGEHTFPNGQLAYRMRTVLPMIDMLDGVTEFWSTDTYLSQSYVDDKPLIWRAKG